MKSLKKLQGLLFFTLLLLVPLCKTFSQELEDTVVQRLVPETFFVGDTVELLYSFDSPIDFFSGIDPTLIKENKLVLTTKFLPFFSPEEKFDVRSVSLSHSGTTYTLSLSLVAWTVGVIDISPFDLNQLISISCKKSIEEEVSAPSYIISLKPFAVASVSERMGSLSVRPPVAPLLLPGTNYVVWSLIALLVFFFFAIIFVLTRFPRIVEALLNFSESMELLKNSRSAGRKLKKLLKKKCGDADFANEWQVIVKHYLSARFSISFASVTSSRLYDVISNLTGDLISDEQENAVMTLVSLFTRTDYIRFAANSIDSKLEPAEDHLAAFSSGERKSLIYWTLDSIRGLE